MLPAFLLYHFYYFKEYFSLHQHTILFFMIKQKWNKMISRSRILGIYPNTSLKHKTFHLREEYCLAVSSKMPREGGLVRIISIDRCAVSRAAGTIRSRMLCWWCLTGRKSINRSTGGQWNFWSMIHNETVLLEENTHCFYR